MANNSLLVIVPAFNEEANIAQVVRGIRAVLRGAEGWPLAATEVLVIDDGSNDGTADVAQAAGALVLRLPYNLGIGGAVQAGFKFACRRGYAFAGRMDGDGQHDPADLARLLQAVLVGQADVAIGSRFHGGPASYRVPLARRLGIRLFAGLVSLLTRRRVTDPTSGLQAVNRRAIEFLARAYPQDYPEIEARILLHRAGLTAIELPAVMAPRRGGVSSINHWRGAYYMVKVLLAVLITAVKKIPTLPA